MPKRPIPMPVGEASLLRILRPLKENLEEIMGQRGGRITPLESTATTSEVIDKLNEVIARLQA